MAERGGRAPTPFLYKERVGDGIPHSFISSFLQLLLPPSIRHGERESWSFNGGGEGRRSTMRPSFSCTRGGRASRKGKGEGEAVGEAGALGEEEDRAARRPHLRQ